MNTRQAVELACVLEATARKPGNTHRERELAGLGYLDLLTSAVAIGPALEAARHGIAPAILAAIRATRAVVDTNANLGIVLCLAPLAAALDSPRGFDSLGELLEEIDPARAALVYEAIRLARPGGLDRVGEQDVHQAPTVGLVAAMRLAADRDTIARQYASAFRDVRTFGLEALLDPLATGAPLEAAIVRCHLAWMACFPDSLILRKRGASEAEESAARARAALERLDHRWNDPSFAWHAEPALVELDRWLTDPGAPRNPGTSADLVTASLFCALRMDRIDVRGLAFAPGARSGQLLGSRDE